MPAPDLSTQRLTLRAARAADADALVGLVNDWEIARWLTQVPHPYTIKDAEAFIARQTSGLTWLIKDAEGLVGCIGTKGEFGYWLGRAFWGRGYATEASIAVLEHHFGQGGDALVSGHAVENARSRNVLLKLGFKDTHRTKRYAIASGNQRNQQVMILTRADWTAWNACRVRAS